MDRLHSIVHNWKTDFDYKTFLSAGASLVASLFFAGYNGFLGVWHHSLWNGSICAYYLLLSIIRMAIILAQHRHYRQSSDKTGRGLHSVFRLSSLALIAMNVTLIIPLSLMVELKKPVTMGLTPAIALATYTVYRITFVTINFRKSSKSENLLTRELRSIGLMDALLAIATTQNALVSVKDSTASGNILIVTAVSSAFLLIAIIAISVRNYLSGMRELRK